MLCGHLLYNKNMKLSLNRGFTLMELLVVMGITVILGGVGTASYFNYQSVQVIEGAASELSGTLRDAHQRAISQDNSSAWGVYINTIDGENDYYEIFYGDSRVSGTVMSRTDLPTGLQFLVPSQGSNKEILFAKSTGFTSIDHTITIVSLRDPSLSRTTQINRETGFISSFSGLSNAPIITSIVPNFALNTETEPVNISNLSGSNFQSDATVKLTKNGQTDRVCTNVVVVDSTKLTFSCDINNAGVGSWNVVVTNPDSQTGTLASGFIVSTVGGNVSGYAWSDNDGWLSFSCDNNSSCNTVDYGVDINSISGLFSGYAWSDNLGWVSFNTSDLVGCPFGTCEARVTGGFFGTFPKSVTGWGRVLSLANASGGGWISLSGTSPSYGIQLASDGKLSGYAWESDVMGWISFSGSNPAYQVLVSGDFGGGEATVPSAPTIGTATAGDAQATIAFTASSSDGGSTITGYTATSNPGGLTGTGSASPITVSGLTNGTAYTFTVTATNVVGTSFASAASNSVTPTASITVPGAPTNLQALSGSAQAQLTWTAPASNGGSSITNYEIYRGTSQDTMPLLVEIGNVLNYLDTGLTNGTTYYYKVAAKNTVGIGTQSSVAQVIPMAVPSVPQNLAVAGGDLRTILTWQAPSDTGGGITNYEVYRGTTSGGETLLTELGNVLTYTDTGVSNGSTYYYKVSAKSSAGEGSQSNEGYQIVWDMTTASAGWSDRYAGAAAVLSGKMWFMGGISDSIELKNDVWYSTDGITWTQATASANWLSRYRHSALAYKDKLWVFGGNGTGGTYKNDVWYSTDGITWTQATASANWEARSNFASLVFDGKMWIFGGVTPNGTPYDYPTYRRHDAWYSTDGITWTAATTNASWDSRQELTAWVYDGKMWIAGGYTGNAYKNDVWYSTDGITWTQATASAAWAARTEMFSGIYNNKMWIMGGLNSSGSLHDIYQSTDGVTWTKIISDTQPVSAPWYGRRGSNTLVFNNKLWLLSGNYGGGGISDVWNIATTVTPPSAPTVSSTLGNLAITLSWSAPSNGGNAIYGYKIYRSTSSGAETFLTEIGNTTSYIDSGLTAGTTYYYKVSAINSNGEGTLSAETYKAVVAYKRIFVTSTNYTSASLGGLSGADTKCATHASNASLSGTWKAWLSDGSTSATSRLSHSSSAYYNMNNQKVANNWSGLINGTLQAAINYNESGVQLTGTYKWVWTGTNTDGTITSTSRTCVNWTSGDWLNGDAMAGYADNTDYHWTQDGYEACNTTGHLYCVEQ